MNDPKPAPSSAEQLTIAVPRAVLKQWARWTEARHYAPCGPEDVDGMLNDMRAMLESAPAVAGAKDHATPAAWVPIHPRNGPLWANAITSLDADHPAHYELMPVYTVPPSATTRSDGVMLTVEAGPSPNRYVTHVLNGVPHKVCDCNAHKGPCKLGRERTLITCELSRCIVPDSVIVGSNGKDHRG